MGLGRGFAGPVVHRINPNGMLITSMILSVIGLVLLSKTTGLLQLDVYIARRKVYAAEKKIKLMQ